MISLGVNTRTGKEILLPETALRSHLHIQGKSGSGKSLLLSKLIVSWLDSKQPVFVIDLGGDLALMNSVRLACEQKGRPFELFSIDPTEDTAYFNPLQGFYPIDESTGKIASTLVGSLGLDHGLGYGKGHFSQQNISVALDAIEALGNRGILRPTLDQLASEVARISNRKKNSGAELAAILRLLSTYQKLDTNLGTGIDIAESIENLECVYFYVETLFQPGVRSMGSFAIFSVIVEMIRRIRSGKEYRHALIAVDEMATIARLSAFSEILTLVRKHDVSLMIANQSTSQLEAADPSLPAIVRENSTTRIYLTPLGDDEASIQLESKDIVRNQESRTSAGFFSQSTTEREVVEPKLTRNEIKDVSDSAFHGFLMHTDGKGHQNPLPFRFEPPDLAEYRRLSRLPIPQLTKKAAVAVAMKVRNPKRVQEVRDLMAALKRQEEWKPSAGTP